MTEEQLIEKLKKDEYFTEAISNLKKYIETYNLKKTELKIELHTTVQ